MAAINDNIKLIRELSGLKQSAFAELIKTNLSNLKTYENTEVRPKANILAAISSFAGVDIEDLDKKLAWKDIKIKVEKVESFLIERETRGEGNLLAQAIVNLTENNNILARNNERLVTMLETNLAGIAGASQSSRVKNARQGARPEQTVKILDIKESDSTVKIGRKKGKYAGKNR